jgi:hypothetical protein
LIELHSSIIVTFHLCLISVLQYFPRPGKDLLIHDAKYAAAG